MSSPFISWVTKNIPTVLTGVSLVATAATAVAASHDTMIAASIFEEKESELGRKLSNKEKFKFGWKSYIPTAACFTVAAAAGIASHGISAAQLASLGAAAGYVTSNRDKIKAKLNEVVKKLPQETQEDIRSTIFHDIRHGVTPPEYERTGHGTTKVIDLYSGRAFLSSEAAVNEGIKRFQKRWEDGEALCLSDLYDEWDIERTTFGYQFGWPNDPDYYDDEIKFHVEWSEDKSVLFVDILTWPMDYWMEV